METFLTLVEDTFEVSNRGLIIAPFFSSEEYKFDSYEKVRIETPEGISIECSAMFQIPFVSPTPEILKYHCALQGISKKQVPIGSKVWIINKKESQFKIGSGN